MVTKWIDTQVCHYLPAKTALSLISFKSPLMASSWCTSFTLVPQAYQLKAMLTPGPRRPGSMGRIMSELGFSL
jgi:hypothetical protein